MAKAKKNTTVTAPNAVGMAAIVAATQGGGFAYTLPAEHESLVADGLVEVNGAMTDGNGAIATRATAKGIESLNTPNTPAAQAAAAPKVKPTFTIESNIPVPAITGRGRTGDSIYPFDQLEVGQSFFVDKPSKNMASTISGANARYAVEVPGETRVDRNNKTVPKMRLTRKFVVRSVEENGVKGSRVWRTEVGTNESAE